MPSRSEELYKRARVVMPGGNTRQTVFRHPFPIYAASGSGCHLVDVDGIRYLDAINNYTALIHGHAHPVVVDAVREQLGRGSSFALPTEAEVELAELLATRIGSVEKIRFTNSGTEAVMMALKAARAYTNRPVVAKCEGAYHGSYDYAEISTEPDAVAWGRAGTPLPVPMSFGTPEGVLQDVAVLPFNDAERSVQILEEVGDRLAGVIVDVLPNRAGLIPAERAYLVAIREATRRIGAVLILDEVISARLADGAAQAVFEVEPDLTTLGKMIGGGFPVGAVGGREDVMRVFDPSRGRPLVAHGGTFNANPVTMVAGLAAMELMSPAEFDRLNALGERAREGLRRAMTGAGVAGQVTGAGSLLRVHFHDREMVDFRSALPSSSERDLSRRFYEALLARGVLVAPYGTAALSTPMGTEEIDLFIDIAGDAFRELSCDARVLPTAAQPGRRSPLVAKAESEV